MCQEHKQQQMQKLIEIYRAHPEARPQLVYLENLPKEVQKQLEKLEHKTIHIAESEFRKIADHPWRDSVYVQKINCRIMPLK